MRDAGEQQRIREHFETEPGKGHLAEEAYGELENARTYGNDGAADRAEARLNALGYQTAGQRAAAAQARRERAEAKAQEEARAQEEAKAKDASPAAAGKDDDGAGDAKAGARRTPPEGRGTAAEKKQTATGQQKAKG